MEIINTLALSLNSLLTQRNSHSAPETIPLESKKTSSGDVHLTLSEKSLSKLSEEQSKLSDNIAKTLGNKDEKQVEDTSDAEQDALDKIIDSIKEKIKEVKRELQSLQNDRTESANKKRKQLDYHLISLNGALMSMIGKKLEITEQS